MTTSINKNLLLAVKNDQRGSQNKLWQMEMNHIATKQAMQNTGKWSQLQQKDYLLKQQKEMQNHLQKDLKINHALGGFDGLGKFASLNKLPNANHPRSSLMVIGAFLSELMLRIVTKIDLKNEPQNSKQIMDSFENSKKVLQDVANTPLTGDTITDSKDLDYTQPQGGGADPSKYKLPLINIAQIDSRLDEATKKLENEGNSLEAPEYAF